MKAWWASMLASALLLAAADGVDSFRLTSAVMQTAGGPQQPMIALDTLQSSPPLTEGGPLCMENPVLAGGEQEAAGYHLIWSPGQLRRTTTTLLCLFLLRFSLGPRIEFSNVAQGAPPLLAGLVNNLVLPLFSSACCGIQLIINAVAGAGGCAGFNKTLGPLRPYFLSIMVYGVVVSMSNKVSWTYRSVLVNLFRLVLAFLPEVVHVCNMVRERMISRFATTPRRDFPFVVDIECSIPSMGCVACINKINSSIQKQMLPQQVEHSRSWLMPEGGGRSSVKFLAKSRENAEETADSISQAIREAGFDPCIVESLAVHER